MKNIAVHIFHRDFRINDNLTLNSISKISVIPIFIFDPRQIENYNKFRSNNAIQFMVESLEDLKKICPLKYFYGLPADVLKDILKNFDKKDNIEIYHMADYTEFAKKRHKELSEVCEDFGYSIHEIHDCLLDEKILGVKTKDGKHYQKYTPFLESVKKYKPDSPSTKKINWSTDNIKSKYNINVKISKNYILIGKQKFPINPHILHNGGRTNGLKQLKKIPNQYSKTRDSPIVPSSELSAYIKFGCLSIREVFHEAVKKLTGNNKAVFIQQLYWNNFGFYLENHFKTISSPLKNPVKANKWFGSAKYFNSWKNARTGIPFVDACMRQLNDTGFCHNRGRLVLANILGKWLGTNWRKGERYFAQILYDYDPCNNNMGWAFTTSFGVDYQNRIYNPYIQGKRHDPDAKFIKKWIPELKNVPANDIHNWENRHEDYDVDYPPPIVNSTESFKSAKEMFK
jgi:deoxyribodipyrimidine photo-lyase